MKIYIDVSVLTLATFVTGIQRVTREIAVRLLDSSEAEVILLHYNAAENVYHRIGNKAFRDYYVEHRGVKEHMVTGEKVSLSEIGKGTVFFDLDAAWMCRLKRSYLLPVLKEQGAKIVVHVYDIISVTHPQYCLERGVYNFMDFIGAHLQYADAIITNAQATVAELEKLCGRIGCRLPQCHVVPLGADFRERQAVSDSAVDAGLVKAASEKPYLLMVGTVEPRKNHKLLLEAYDCGLKEQGYNIIFAGYMGWNMEDFEKKLKEHPDYGKGVYHFSGLDDDGISYLYQRARFLVFASYTEGFGLPIIESIQRGTPVLAADEAIYREVAGDYCVWFRQEDALELCRRVAAYDREPDSYAALRERMKSYPAGSWDMAVEEMNRVLCARLGSIDF